MTALGLSDGINLAKFPTARIAAVCDIEPSRTSGTRMEATAERFVEIRDLTCQVSQIRLEQGNPDAAAKWLASILQFGCGFTLRLETSVRHFQSGRPSIRRPMSLSDERTDGARLFLNPRRCKPSELLLVFVLFSSKSAGHRWPG